ncbi:hypothetical protein [Pseudonocardia sp.]|uniref:hypothetical protein n=1 Tax=Pseudonocardia sp. TaxID=60912 RepID=UPI003D0F0594
MPEQAGQPVAAAAPDVLDASERDELTRLRAEVEALRAAGPPPPSPRPRRHIRWASVGSAILLVLGVLAVPVSVIAVWAHTQVTDTDEFVATVSPVFSEPSVQQAVGERITNEVFTRIDVEQIVNETVDALAAQGLPPVLVERLRALSGPIADGARGFVEGRVDALVASPQFISAAERALTVSHEQLNTVLSGNSQAITVQGGSAVLDLAPFIDAAKQQLVASGFELAGRIPEVHPTIDLFPASTLVRAQSAYAALETLADWLPWITLLLLAGGVMAARRKRRALIGVGIGLMAVMVVLAVALLVARGVLVGAVAQQAAVPTAAAFDIVVRFLRVAIRTLFVVGLVVAVGAWLSGPSSAAVQVRSTAARGVAALRRGAIATRLAQGPVGPWVHDHRGLLRVVVVVIGVLLLLFLNRPTGLDVLGIAIVVVVLLGVVEFLDQPGAPPVDAEAAVPAGSTGTGDGGEVAARAP